ncbi:MAG: hypothetical protein J6X62_02460 [Bacteroidales bacterium]|nr:hypothetical protein [Bacteroidales bacterium]
MKRIAIIIAVLMLGQSAVYAQKNKVKSVSEKDVPERYVKDFQRKSPEVMNVSWTMVDSMIYDATFTNSNGTKQVYRFSPRGSETRYYIEPKYYPKAIQDTVSKDYPKFKIKELYALDLKGKMTYQVLITKKKGKEPMLLNFEVTGKFIDAITLE